MHFPPTGASAEVENVERAPGEKRERDDEQEADRAAKQQRAGGLSVTFRNPETDQSRDPGSDDDDMEEEERPPPPPPQSEPNNSGGKAKNKKEAREQKSKSGKEVTLLTISFSTAHTSFVPGQGTDDTERDLLVGVQDI